jgi:hypothetical protein
MRSEVESVHDVGYVLWVQCMKDQVGLSTRNMSRVHIETESEVARSYGDESSESVGQSITAEH